MRLRPVKEREKAYYDLITGEEPQVPVPTRDWMQVRPVDSADFLDRPNPRYVDVDDEDESSA